MRKLVSEKFPGGKLNQMADFFVHDRTVSNRELLLLIRPRSFLQNAFSRLKLLEKQLKRQQQRSVRIPSVAIVCKQHRFRFDEIERLARHFPVSRRSCPCLMA